MIAALSVIVCVMGWCLLLGFTGNLALLMLLAGIFGFVWSAWKSAQHRIEREGLVAILPSSVSNIVLHRSVLEILRPQPEGPHRPSSTALSSSYWTDSPVLQTGGVAVAAAILSFIDEDSFAFFFTSLPQSIQNLLTMEGGIYFLLPRNAQRLIAPDNRHLRRNVESQLNHTTSTKLHQASAKMTANGIMLDSKHANANTCCSTATRLADAPEGKDINGNLERKEARHLSPVRDDNKATIGESKLVLSRRDMDRTVEAAESLVYRLIRSMYEPAERQLISVAQSTASEAFRSFFSIFQSVDQRQVNAVGGISLLSLLLQLAFVKKARNRTWKLAEVLLYVLTLLTITGSISLTALRKIAMTMLTRRRRSALNESARAGAAQSRRFADRAAQW
eukprot:CAMPEP_0184481512 /NCGR_PEP_ID=MMETSP0113_2-20130426/3062_1 /TAXON_ID=91329 /ORGANISM="Norrisiella sphaerica, Strain BC52" /LENGTH=391 /DNA_ID=CAMNT_0026860681 /DNA_START=21 /DNA_END=1193 /DNA_ORIENTATION=-